MLSQLKEAGYLSKKKCWVGWILPTCRNTCSKHSRDRYLPRPQRIYGTTFKDGLCKGFQLFIPHKTTKERCLVYNAYTLVKGKKSPQFKERRCHLWINMGLKEKIDKETETSKLVGNMDNSRIMGNFRNLKGHQEGST